MSLGLDIISIKQMATNRRSSAEGTTTLTLSFFPITLLRAAKSLFTSNCPCNIAMKDEAYKAKNVTTAEGSATSGQIASNLPVACAVGGNRLHNECPEKGNPSSTPTGMLQLPAGRHISDTKKEVPENTQDYGWVLSNFTTPALHHRVIVVVVVVIII
jgi:hypothetical protein